MSGDDLDRLLRDSAADFLAGRHSTARLKNGVGVPRPADRGLWREMAEMGWLNLLLPEAKGGLGQPLTKAAILAQEFGRAALPEPFVAASVMPSLLLAGIDSDTADTLTQHLESGDRLLCFAWQESAAQIAQQAISTRLADGQVSGHKRFVSGIEADGILLVSAQREGVPVVAAIETAAPGLGLDCFAAGLGQQAHVAIDRAPLLGISPALTGGEAAQAIDRALRGAGIAIAAQLAGLASAALAMTVAYVGGRKQFGKAIGSFQSVRHRCVDLHIACELANACWRHAAAAFDTNPDSEDTLAAVSAAKARCGDTALLVTRAAVQLHGAMGFTEEADIGLYLRQALHLSAWLGNGTVHRRRFLSLNPVEELANAG